MTFTNKQLKFYYLYINLIYKQCKFYCLIFIKTQRFHYRPLLIQDSRRQLVHPKSLQRIEQQNKEI